MTIEQKAEEWIENKSKKYFTEFYITNLTIRDFLKKCCVEFANEVTQNLLEHNKKLETQIEKMKCCGNCKHNKHCVDDWKGTREVIINFKSYTCKNKDKWELAE